MRVELDRGIEYLHSELFLAADYLFRCHSDRKDDLSSLYSSMYIMQCAVQTLQAQLTTVIKTQWQ